MISNEDIQAFSGDLATADRIIERAKRGVPAGRHIMANEEMPLIRAYALLRATAEKAAEYMTEQHQREVDGMGLGPTKPKG